MPLLLKIFKLAWLFFVSVFFPMLFLFSFYFCEYADSVVFLCVMSLSRVLVGVSCLFSLFFSFCLSIYFNIYIYVCIYIYLYLLES